MGDHFDFIKKIPKAFLKVPFVWALLSSMLLSGCTFEATISRTHSTTASDENSPDTPSEPSTPPSSPPSTPPPSAPPPSSGKTISQVIAGASHSCALFSDGSLKCWGRNDYGQLGNNSYTDSSYPVAVLNLGQKAISVAIGHSMTCAVLEDHTIKCWGENQEGQLGDGTNNDSPLPVNVAGISTAITTTTDGYHVCALLQDKTVKCWGDNDGGQLGDGSNTNRLNPTSVVGLTDVVSLASSWDSTCALLQSGSIKCWGDNDSGQLGNGTTVDSNTPVDVTGITTATSITGSNWFDNYCALLQDKTVKCWGENSNGQLGNNSTTDSNIPVSVSNLSDVTFVQLGADGYVCALTHAGQMKCWGGNFNGQLGDNTTNDSLVPIDATVTSGFTSPIQSIATGGDFTCALLQNQSLKCWGYNNEGQLGNGGTTDSMTPETTVFKSLQFLVQPSPIAIAGVALIAQPQVAALDVSDQIITSASDSVTLTVYTNSSCSVPATGSFIVDSNPLALTLGTASFSELKYTKAETIYIKASVTGYASICSNAVAVGPGPASQLLIAGHTTLLGNACSRPFTLNTTDAYGNNSAISSPKTYELSQNGSAQFYGDSNCSSSITSLGLGANLSSNSFFIKDPSIESLTVTATDPFGALLADSANITVATVVSIDSGGNHSCFVLSNGEAQCWGNNDIAQLGDGTNKRRTTPTPTLPLLSGVTLISAGNNHSCVALSTGAIQCWGINTYGQLGNGQSGGTSYTPVTVIGISTATQVAAGNGHTCAVLGSGSIQCWGDNQYGQLGNGTTTASSTPVTVSGIANAIKVVVGISHSCALLSSGAVNCWGRNNQRQLGDGTVVAQQTTPTTVVGVSTATDIDSGWYHNCIRLSSGAVQCWGYGGIGQLGNGASSNSNVPVNATGISTATSVSAGSSHSCARLNDGTLKCWGGNSNGQLGDGTTTGRNTPNAVSNISNAVSLSSGTEHTCVLLNDNTVQCWGDYRYGQLGNGISSYSSTPVTVVGISNATQVSSGNYSTCATLSTGASNCWGSNSSGQLGNGTMNDAYTPISVTGIATSIGIASGAEHSCSLLSDSTGKCWGKNGAGRLGDGTTSTRTTPVFISGLASGSVLEIGDTHSCVVLSSGQAQCWGDNWVGKLGDGTTSSRSTPTNVSGLTTAAKISAGKYHTCSLLIDGTVQCWGYNGWGQLGNGTNSDSSIPVITTNVTNASSITAGGQHSCARLNTGGVKCWGRNVSGQLGLGNNVDKNIATDVNGLPSALDVSAGESHTCALLSSGQVQCWGDNSYGQLGDGTYTSSYIPVTVSGISSAISISTSYMHTCAVLNTGEIKCWGNDATGQLGRGRALIPVSVIFH